MISAPRFSSFTVNDPASNKVLRATEIPVETTTEIDEVTNEELTVKTSNVRISEEALDTLGSNNKRKPSAASRLIPTSWSSRRAR